MQPSFDFGHKCSLGHCHFVPTGEDATRLKLARKVFIYTPYFPYLHGVTFLHDVMSYLAKVKSVDSKLLSLVAKLLDAL